MNWPIEELYLAIEPLIPAFRAQVLPSIDSTNTELMRRSKDGITGPLLLIAEEQTAGKGRLGRSWVARPGESLTFSIGLNVSAPDWSGFSLAVGLGILNALDPLRQYGIALKWPNDLWVGPVSSARKLGGILIESTLTSNPNHSPECERYCVIGVGINLVAPTGVDLKRVAVGLCEIEPHSTAGSILLKVVPYIVQNVLRFEGAGFAAFVSEYASCDILLGQQVSMSNGLVGRACGVNPRGELIIQTHSGVSIVASDEVSLVGMG